MQVGLGNKIKKDLDFSWLSYIVYNIGILLYYLIKAYAWNFFAIH